MNGKRLGYVDSLKGLSILCIMLLHFEDGVFTETLNVFVGSFMITAFYVTTGVVYVRKGVDVSLKATAWKRFQQLMIPYIWFSLLILLFDGALCAFGLYPLITFEKELYYTLTLRGIGTLWFLPVLFVAELSFLYSCRRVGRILLVSAVAVLCLILYNRLQVCGILNRSNITSAAMAAVAITVCRVATALLVIGATYHVERTLHFLSATAWRTAVVGVGFILAGAFLSCAANVPDNWRWCSTIYAVWLIPYGLLLVFCSLRCVVENGALIYFGRNSLIVMLTHYSFLLTVCCLLDKYVIGNPLGHLYGVSSLLWFLIALGVQVPVISVINKRFAFLIGR